MSADEHGTDGETLAALVRHLAREGDHPALVLLDDDVRPGDERNGGVRSIARARLCERARALGRGLRADGLEPGDRAVLYGANGESWITACLGLLDAGAVPVPVDEQLAGRQLHHVLRDSEPRAVLADRRGVARIERAFDGDVPDFARYRLDTPDDDDDDDAAGLERLMARGREHRREDSGDGDVEPQAQDPAVLFYTSGTTGAPKGVPLTHAQIVFELRALERAGLVEPGERVLLPLPAHHVYPFVMGLLAPLRLGLPVILPRSLSGPDLMRALRDGEATLLIGVPRLYSALLDGIDARIEGAGVLARGVLRTATAASGWSRRRLRLRLGRWLLAPLHRRVGPRLRTLASGGSPLDPKLAWRLEGFGWRVALGYGLTETAPMVTLHPAGADRFETVGWPLEGVEVRIACGRDGKSAPRGGHGADRGDDGDGEQGQGEILVRGPNVFDGYRNLPRETEKVLDADGWFHTGDLGCIEPDGALRLLGRESTLIVTAGGENVQPDQVEAEYEQSAVVREVGVIEREGALAAVVVPDTAALGRDDDPEEAVRHALRERSRALPSHHRIDTLRVTRESLPRTRLGDLQRHRLRERFERAGEGGGEGDGEPLSPEQFADADRALVESPAGRAAWDWLCERYPDRRLGPDTSFRLDLGVDSMEWVELSLDLSEHTGVVLREETIAGIDTVRDLLEAIVEASDEGEAGEVLAEDPKRLLGERDRRLLTPHGAGGRLLRRALHATERALLRAGFDLEVQGGEHVPCEGPWVIAANHQSYLDPFAIAAALDHARLRAAWWGGWVGITHGNPAMRLFSRLAQVIPVDPEAGGLASLAASAAVLERGECLIWFPEGRRSPDGRLQAFRPGLGLLLEHRPVPVIPVLLSGAHAAWPPGRTLPRPRSRLCVTFGESLSPREHAADRLAQEARERLLQMGAREGD